MDILTPSSKGESRQTLQQKAKRQKLTRLFRGAYVDAVEFAAMSSADQYRTRARAFLLTHPELEPWGITAAALKGAPVLASAPLHFAGERNKAQSRQAGCTFHANLPDVPKIANSTAKILFECALSSPLPDTLLAANYLLRQQTLQAKGCFIALCERDESTTDSFIRETLDAQSKSVPARAADERALPHAGDSGFLTAYTSARRTELASTEAELLWHDFALLCQAFSAKRAIRKVLRAGVFFTDQAKSPAESLLVARCVELGFDLPFLQVSILKPVGKQFLGRVDGLWPSDAVLKAMYFSDTKHGRLLFSKQQGDYSSIVIEFDGKTKCQQDQAEALEKERQRHNAISNLGFRFVRVGWADLMEPLRLSALLTEAGAPKKSWRKLG